MCRAPPRLPVNSLARLINGFYPPNENKIGCDWREGA